jgi:hypothetical protein
MTRVLRAQLVGDTYVCEGFKASGLPELCRKLIEASVDPQTSVECYRPGRAAWDIRATSLRKAAQVQIRGDGIGFCQCTASPVRDRASPVGRQPPEHKSHLRGRTLRGSEVRS